MNKAQKKLQSEVNKLIAQFGEQKAIQIIKQKEAKGIWYTMKNYPNGVYVYCDSEEGGVMIGSKH